MCLDQPGFPLCWVVMLSCYTWVIVVIMNINDELALNLCHIFAFLIQDHMHLLEHGEPPRKTVQPQEQNGH
jgi:hypothetical protein